MDEYPPQVIAIKGNHETMFIDFLLAEDDDFWNVEWLGTDKDFKTVNSFISSATKGKIKILEKELGYEEYLFQAALLIKRDILLNHKELISWLQSLPLYYETNTQIFVHAGIDEEAGEFWKYGTPDEYFVGKYPATFGEFYKDIIAGHIGTSALSGDENYHGIFWDQQSHFFIDGTVELSQYIPLLKCDTNTRKYIEVKKL